MAATDIKRPLPVKVASMKARKRQKLGAVNGEAGSVPKTSLRQTVQRKPVRIDALDWKSVSMPDRLDDYEGFFGLEEVDGVEIVRDEATGTVSYMSMSAAKSEPNGKRSKAGGDDQRSDDGDEEEWSGIEDEPSQLASEMTVARNVKKSKPTKLADPKERSSAKSPGVTTSIKTNGVFSNFKDEENSAEVDIAAWKPLKLSPDTLASLSKLGFPKPTPIQRSAIPEILSGRDVIGKASTGSGKTLAFGVPILERFLELRSTTSGQTSKSGKKLPLALILSPTRELAHQLDKHLTDLCSSGLFEGPSIATLTGGLAVQKQQRLLEKADIVIGTPGRLWEVMSSGHGTMEALKRIQFLVVDEADRLLTEGHFKEVEEILNALDRQEQDSNDDAEDEKQKSASAKKGERQTLVFSATFDRSLQARLIAKQKAPRGGDLLSNKESLEYLLAKINFHDEQPQFIDVNPIHQLATGLKEGLIECGGTEKDLYLYTTLLLHPGSRALVFTNSISAVRRLTPFLQNLGLPALALHSGMPQKARLRSVERFTTPRDGSQSTILVATDVAARGLDIPNVQLVIHYHLPRTADAYVHRSGRTARAGQPGSSILICGPEEVAGVRRLVAKVHARSAAETTAKKAGFYIRTLDLDRRVVSRLKPRATLAKKLADTTMAKEKRHREDDFLRTAAEELGVDYDGDEFAMRASPGRKGRGAGREKKEREARALTKAEVGAIKAELRGLLAQRVNVGVSERYLTSGGVDVKELLRQREGTGGRITSAFLGSVDGVMGMEEDV